MTSVRNQSGRVCHVLALGLALACAPSGAAAIRLLAHQGPLQALAGETNEVELIFANTSDSARDVAVSTRLFQLSSATAMPATDVIPWKILKILPQQTIVEHFKISFPEVRAETQYEIRFSDDTRERLGHVRVTVHARDLLQHLASFAGGKPIGVFDPENELTPMLKSLNLETENLGEAGFSNFAGTLAIVGPISTNYTSLRELHGRVVSMVKHGVRTVFIVPRAHGYPRFAVISPDNGTRLTVLWSEVVADLKNSAAAQLNLIEGACWATRSPLLEIQRNR